MKKIVSIIAALAFSATLSAGIAEARPVTDQHNGSANHSNCEVVKSTDRGYRVQIWTVRQYDDNRISQGWVTKRIKDEAAMTALKESGVKYRILADKGTKNILICR